MLDRVKNEIGIHTRTQHQAIVGFKNAFLDRDNIYMVMEYCDGGDLAKEMKRRANRPFSEDEARRVVQQVAKGLLYLHKNNIFHRDITMANILVDGWNREEGPSYKIADFGLAVENKEKEKTHMTLCGTPNAIAPEVVKKEPYDFQVDIWGLGTILYTLLVGRQPFDDGNVKSTLKRTVHQNPSFPPGLSQNAIHLINGMLQKDEGERFTLQQVLRHPFVTAESSFTTSSLLTGDSGIGTTTLSSSQPTMSTTASCKRWPEIRQPLLFGSCLSEVTEERRPMSRVAAAEVGTVPGVRVRSATPPVLKEEVPRPRSASLDRLHIERLRQDRGFPKEPKHQQSLCPPLSTLRLLPTKKPQQLKNGIRAAILADGSVQISLEIPHRKSGRITLEWITVSCNGQTIRVERGSSMENPSTETQVYQHEHLPRNYWQKYNIIYRYVNFVRETTPKVTLYTDQAQCRLMENLPVANFEVNFYQGPKIKFFSSNGRITYSDDYGPVESFSYPINKSTNDNNLSYLKQFEDWHLQCKTIVNLLEDNSNDLTVAFPAVIGRRTKSTSSALVAATTSPIVQATKPFPTGISFSTINSCPTSTILSNTSKYSYQTSPDFVSTKFSSLSTNTGEYREHKFRDGTVLQMPKDKNSCFRYRNLTGIWETNERGSSVEMQEKINLVFKLYSSRSSKDLSYTQQR